MLHDVVEHIFFRLLIIGFILKKLFQVSYKTGLRTIRIYGTLPIRFSAYL